MEHEYVENDAQNIEQMSDRSTGQQYVLQADLPDHPALLEIKKIPRWVAWRYEDKDGRLTKRPKNPANGSNASVSDPSTWSSYEQARAAQIKHGFAGVGFVLIEGDNLCGGDLDHCLDWCGDLPKETYWEYSPSGEGIRFLFRGDPDTLKCDPAGVEIYKHGRFLTITGNHVEGSPLEINEAPATLAALTARVSDYKAAKALPQALSERATTAIQPPAGTGFYIDTGGPKSPFWRAVNDAAMADLDRWVPDLLPAAKKYGNGAWRITSRNLGRDLEEDLSFHPQGIRDHGEECTLTPIDAVQQYGRKNAIDAAHWLCDRLGIDPVTLGWNGHIEARQTSGAPAQDKPVLPLQDSAVFCAARTPADYLIDGSLRDGWLYTLTAPTGHGKSAVALSVAFTVARGGYLGSYEVKQGTVLFLAGENADDIRERWIAMCEWQRIEPEDMPVVFMPGVWDLKGSLPLLHDYFKARPLRLVIVDTLAAFFDGDNENDNAQQQEFATRVLRPLTELPGRPAVLVPAHPTKGAGKDSLTPKGGSSLLNAVDGNLSAWNTDGTVQVHWQGKFRGAPWAPLFFELSEYQSPQLHDSRGRIMPTVVCRAILDSEIGSAKEQSVKIENQVLKLLSDGLTVRGIAADVIANGQRGISKSRADRIIRRFAEQKWITKSGRRWALTKQGLAVLQQARETVDLDA